MANIEALWSVHFRSNDGQSSSGVVVLETERFFGGDIAWYYVGNYEVKDGRISGDIRVEHHGEYMDSIFGHRPGETFKLNMVGVLGSDDTIKATIAVVGEPGKTGQLDLKRLADLP